jgi:hypothetical protein
VLTGTSDGVAHFANVFHVRCADISDFSPDVALELLDDLISAFDGSGFYDQMIADAEITNARLRVSNGVIWTPVEQAVTTLAGTRTGEHVGGQTAMVVSWRGTWSYRGGKPRTYIAGLDDEAFASPIQLASDIVVAQRAAAVELIANILALTGAYGSDVQLGALIGNNATASGAFYPFTTALVTQQIGTIRRRAKA